MGANLPLTLIEDYFAVENPALSISISETLMSRLYFLVWIIFRWTPLS